MRSLKSQALLSRYSTLIIFLIPALTVFTLFVVLPIGEAAYYSFFRWNGYGDPEKYVGFNNEGCGDMYFNRTLEDWARFDINNRTKFDASISSGLAIMACNKNLYTPVQERQVRSINLGIKRYDNKGSRSKII